jgi:hypothetical protein
VRILIYMTERSRSWIRGTVAILVLTTAVIGTVALVVYVVSHLWGLFPAALIVAVVVCGKADGRPVRRERRCRVSVPTRVPHPFTINWVKRPW